MRWWKNLVKKERLSLSFFYFCLQLSNYLLIIQVFENFHTPHTSQSKKVLLRLKIEKISKDRVDEVLDILKNTKYKRIVNDELSPWITSCVTFTRFFIEKITDGRILLPKAYIGNMPRQILESWFHESKLIPFEDAQIGDISFFYGNSIVHRAKMIRHIGVITDDTLWFHHSVWGKDKSGGMRKWSLQKKESNKWHNILATESQIYWSHDPRTK